MEVMNPKFIYDELTRVFVPDEQTQRQIDHILENLDLFREHQVDPTVDVDYLINYFKDHSDEPIYLWLCSDLGLEPRYA